MADIVPDALRIQLKAYDSTGSGGMMVAYPETLINRVLDYVPDVTQRINDAIGSAGHLTYQVWPNSGTFPPDPQFNVIYLIPASGGGIDKNVYDEYMWMVATSGGTASWEIIGNTRAEIGGFLPYSGTITSTHAIVGISGGTVADAGLTFGNGTLTNAATKIAREDGVYVHVSKRITDATSAYKASKEAFGVVKAGDNITVSGGVISVPLADTVSSNLPGVVYATSDATLPEYVDPAVPTGGAVKAYVSNALSGAFGAQTLTGAAPIVVSGGTVSINAATSTTSGAVILSNAVANVTTAAITPAAVSGGLAAKVGVSGTFTASHVLLTKDTTGKVAIDGGRVVGSATFNTTAAAGSSTLATEAGVSAYVAAASPKEPPAGYTAASSGVMYVVSSGGALTITSGGLNIHEATSGTPGVVKIGSNISVSAGTISVPVAGYVADGGSPGVVYVASSLEDVGNMPAVPDALVVSAAISGAVADAVYSSGSFTNDHLVKISGGKAVDAKVSAGGTTFTTVTGASGSTLATEAGVKAWTSANVSSILPDASYTVKGKLQVQNGGALTIAGGTLNISSAAVGGASGAVQLTSDITSTHTKAPTEGSIYSNCIFYSIV